MSVHDVFGNAAVFHSTHVSELTQSALAKAEVYAQAASLLQRRGIGDFIMPCDHQDLM